MVNWEILGKIPLVFLREGFLFWQKNIINIINKIIFTKTYEKTFNQIYRGLSKIPKSWSF